MKLKYLAVHFSETSKSPDMKLITCFASLLFISFITGCGNGSTTEDTPVKTENTADVQTAVPVDTTPAKTVTANPQQVTNTPTTTTFTAPTTAVTTAAGLNPEHGKPGHRCDIAVGAPLDSKPTPTTAVNPQTNFSSIKAPSINTSPVATKTPVINTSAPSTTATVANGLNPEHGKPGHRCEIAVGAPLDSKPVVTTGVPSSTVSTSSQTATPTTPATVANGLNPEHGKPGHRCDIAVGAPLDSKPKQ